jgi:2-C-methyl-D-erythritol 2,4-cyclodiphosphate synthase
MRIGQGIDVHRFSVDPSRELWLGLVLIPDAVGLEGHSDADVATHALIDALLGAANLGDIGHHFPPTDPRYAGASSSDMLAGTTELLAGAGYRVTSADLTIIAEQPKLAWFIPTMSERLSEVVGATVSVKATTVEGLGALGRQEGIGASAVVLIEEVS